MPKLAMIIFDALGIDLARQADMKNLCRLYMDRNSEILTCSTFPHTMTSNIMIWGGESRNFFWIRNKSDKWMDPAHVFHRDTVTVDEDIELIKYDELKDINWVWEILEKNGYKARAVQIPFILPPYSFNAKKDISDTEHWFPYSKNGLYNNLRDMEKITMDSLKELADNELDFFCTSFPQPDKLLHGVPEGNFDEKFALQEIEYLDNIASKIDDYCNKKNIIYCIFGDHGPCRPEGDEFSYHPEQKIAVVRHRKYSVIISNYIGDLPCYTDEVFQWILDYFNIKNTEIQKTKEEIQSIEEDEKIIKERLRKLGYI